MARPQTNTVVYFSHDTDASEGKTLTIMEGQFGLEGFAFWYKLLEKLGKTEGHYIDCQNEEDFEFLARKFGLGPVSVTEMLDKLSKLRAIDRVLWFHKIIWSQNFVDRLEDVYSKRKRELPAKPDYCNGNCNHAHLYEDVSVTETPVLGAESTQSKVKYIILYNNKEDAEKTWGTVLKLLSERVSKSNYKTYLEGTNALGYLDKDFVIETASDYIASYLHENQRSLVEKALAEVLGKPVKAVFQVKVCEETE